MGCGPSKPIDVETFLGSGQTSDGALIEGVVGNSSHDVLTASAALSTHAGLGLNKEIIRLDMADKPVASISRKSTKDDIEVTGEDGKVAALLKMETTPTARGPVENGYKKPKRKSTVYSVKPRLAGQAPVLSVGDTPMYHHALFESYCLETGKLAWLVYAPSDAAGADWTVQPVMMLKPGMKTSRDFDKPDKWHVLPGGHVGNPSGQALGVTEKRTVTAAAGVDPVIIVLAQLDADHYYYKIGVESGGGMGGGGLVGARPR